MSIHSEQHNRKTFSLLFFNVFFSFICLDFKEDRCLIDSLPFTMQRHIHKLIDFELGLCNNLHMRFFTTALMMATAHCYNPMTIKYFAWPPNNLLPTYLGVSEWALRHRFLNFSLPVPLLFSCRRACVGTEIVHHMAI